MLEGDYASYSIGLIMEYPIGNRDRLANLRQRKFERTKAIVTMQNTADQIAVSIQERIRQIGSSHDQIVAQHAAVKASEAQLSAIEVTEKVRARLTPEFLQLKLQVQQTLASSQQAELQAMVDYNSALADLARITGTILDQHRVEISMSQVVNGQWTPATPTSSIGFPSGSRSSQERYSAKSGRERGISRLAKNGNSSLLR
jgi:outer membrane protein TolC